MLAPGVSKWVALSVSVRCALFVLLLRGSRQVQNRSSARKLNFPQTKSRTRGLPVLNQGLRSEESGNSSLQARLGVSRKPEAKSVGLPGR